MHYTLQEAKAQLSRLLTEAESGKEVIITRRNRPSVRLQPVHLKTSRVLGAWKGKYPPVGDAALEAMTDWEAEEFLEGR
jgi:prevent-host-death family protein